MVLSLEQQDAVWERLRQYLPKQADLACFTQTDLDRIADKINTRPRRVLGWDTSHDRLLDALMT